MVTASHTIAIVETLLDNRPLTIGCDHEAVQIDLKTVGKGVVIDPRSKATSTHKRVTIQPAPSGNRS
jgi:hypothetical protein